MFVIGLIISLIVTVFALQETNHLVQTDHQGRIVHMDVIHDIEEKTVMAIIGDVSEYGNSVQTVNFHDYNKGFGVLKDVNKGICILAHSLVPMASAEKYRSGVTTEVHDHFLHVSPTRLNVQDVEKVAGPKIASFCKDYQTFNAVATPITHQKRAQFGNVTTDAWCVFSSCSFNVLTHIFGH